MNRRSFLKSAAVAGATLTTTPSQLWAADGRVVLALVGCAHIHTPGFVNLLKGRADVTVKWVWDPDPRRAERWARELGCPMTADVHAVWADPVVQGVVICSETTRHAELVAAAARAKKHLFVEKPLGVTARESRVMAKQIEEAGLHFTTGYFMRTDPTHLFLQEQIARGAFGRITRAAAWNCHSGSLGGWFDEKPDNVAESWRWMANPKISGVGAFGDLGTHSLVILMWLLGGVDSVSSDTRVVTGRYGPDCDENGQSLMRFRSGVMGTLTAGWVDVANPVTLMISGTEGNAVIVRDQLYFKAKDFDDREPVKVLPPAPALPLHQFVDAVSGKGGRSLVTPREAAARVAVMEAMYRSAKARRWSRVA